MDNQAPLPSMVKEEIEKWHRSFPADLVRNHIEELKAQRDGINQQIAALEDEYARWQASLLPAVQSNGTSQTEAQSYDRAETAARRRPVPRAKAKVKRRAIMDFLEARYPKKVPTAAIRRRLIADGIVSDDLAGRKNVDAVLYHMNREGLIERAGRGLYRRAPQPPGKASAQTDVHGQDGGGS